MSEVQHAGCLAAVSDDRNLPVTDLLSPLTIRGVTFRNRVVMSPMCQYSAVDGMADDWHLVNVGSRAAGGVGLAVVEATAISPEGRISPGDLGIWSDAHAQALERTAAFTERMGAVPGIQLAHAGRKASCRVPWEGGGQIPLDAGGWQTLGPSAVPFAEKDRPPQPLDEAGIRTVIGQFRAAAQRAVRAGFRVIELHAAHGYLLHEFLSPLSNRRTDRYGGSLENRMRIVLEAASALREAMPQELPLFVRISATDWVEGGWDLPQSVALAKALKPLGVDLIDCSSGALVPGAKIPVGKGYQVPFADAIRKEAEVMTGAVGLITEPQQANEIVTSGAADLVFLARELLREPYWALHAQKALNQEPSWPTQYGYAVKRRT
jgi:2,4-dienoyl-CoA reductase (NADPH2)